MQKRKICLLKGEKFLYFVIGVLVLANLLGPAFSSAMLSKTNIEVESMKSKITKQEKYNESLSMKINELSSLDKIESVATSLGLEYNNSNIRIISE